MFVYLDLFFATIMRKDTVPVGVEYLRQARRCYIEYTGDHHHQSAQVQWMEELIASPQKHPQYLALDRKTSA